jgi:branched-chain amino acid transport system substrate-binding protein
MTLRLLGRRAHWDAIDSHGKQMIIQKRHTRRAAALSLTLGAAVLLSHPLAWAADSGPIKIGVILPMTGQSASTGRQIDAAIKLWVAQNGNKIAGRTVEVILKDDGALPDATKRIAQELIVNDKVSVIAGFGITPTALSTAPLATQSKTPLVVMAAATSSITEASPYIVRTSFTLPQVTIGIADWAAKNGVKKAVTLVADYGPGFDAEKYFDSQFRLDGGQVLEKLRTPLKPPISHPRCKKLPTSNRMPFSSSCHPGKAPPS